MSAIHPHHIISFVHHVVTDGRKLESRKFEWLYWP